MDNDAMCAFTKITFQGDLLINLPHYDPMEALKAAMSVVKDMDIRMLNKPHGSNSSARGIHFALPVSAVRENDSKASHVPPIDMQQDKNQENVVSPPLKPRPVGVKGTKRTRPEDDGDEQRSPKRPDLQGFTGWFPWSSASPEPRSGN
ncbi:hypothetical protein FDENT_7793 [Fusarium denticulatum]|uniref:Uncharacterized protein n=1 Tax=Fusarium denticulatum TaxID=48507 RepID=A0A8H5X3P6_9HYPO|nr:hypothetical protein FDENT_7793 [Fusarium denticulatum]